MRLAIGRGRFICDDNGAVCEAEAPLSYSWGCY
jgi:hypothetical protein